MAKDVLDRDVEGEWIEVGCWEGRSTVMIANLIRPRVLHAVDHWQGDGPGTKLGTLAEERDVHATFAANIRDLTEGNVAEHRMGWRQFFAIWNQPIAFIHIDGAHTYTEVRDNLRVVLPLLMEGGCIVGDDWHTPGVSRAAFEVLGRAVERARSTWWWRL